MSYTTKRHYKCDLCGQTAQVGVPNYPEHWGEAVLPTRRGGSTMWKEHDLCGGCVDGLTAYLVAKQPGFGVFR